MYFKYIIFNGMFLFVVQKLGMGSVAAELGNGQIKLEDKYKVLNGICESLLASCFSNC